MCAEKSEKNLEIAERDFTGLMLIMLVRFSVINVTISYMMLQLYCNFTVILFCVRQTLLKFFYCSAGSTANCWQGVHSCFLSGGVYLSKLIQSKARLFTRNIKEPGAAFEYVLFENSQEETCVGIFQNGHLLEGPPGWDTSSVVNPHLCLIRTLLCDDLWNHVDRARVKTGIQILFSLKKGH